MPQLLEHIDAIARKKQRGVLFVCFHPEKLAGDEDDSWLNYDYQKDARRKKVIKWLDANKIPWNGCGPMASEYGFRSYLGEIYLDIPYDEADPRYQKVCSYLENHDGTLRDENVRWYYLPLEVAMKNAHHDEPGFWERWADDF